MAESRSDSVHADAIKSSEQFDYFVLALISGIVAYLAQNVQASLLSSPSYDMYLVSMIVLLLSMFSGFMRIEQNILIRQINHLLLHAGESRGELVGALQNEPSSAGYLNARTGNLDSREELIRRVTAYGNEMNVRQSEIEKAKTKAFRCYKMRNRLFLLGFLGAFLAKVLSPYIN